jgi:tetratricopeptide (TPR) repeat protein
MIVRLGLDEKGVETFSQDAPVNTDDNMLLELAVPRSLYLNRMSAVIAEMENHAHSVIDLLSGYSSKADVFLELAISFFSAGQKEEAYRHIVRALEIEDSFHGRRMLGQTLLSLGRHEEAREAFNRALSLGGDEQARQFVAGLLRSIPPTANK